MRLNLDGEIGLLSPVAAEVPAIPEVSGSTFAAVAETRSYNSFTPSQRAMNSFFFS
jgi:hypothetical protein